MTLKLDNPVLETERLILRPNRAEDFEPYAEFYESVRSLHRGAPAVVYRHPAPEMLQ